MDEQAQPADDGLRASARGGAIEIDAPCRTCQYNLRGLPRDGQCPECNTPIRTSIPGVEISEQGTVLETALCGRCGYDLRGLNIDGVCPECGVPTRASVEGMRLVGASHAYVATLHRGAICVSVAAVMHIVAWTSYACSSVMNVAFGQMSSAAVASGVLSILGAMMGFIGLVVFLVGWWMLTAPDPVPNVVRRDGARRITRVSVGLIAGVIPVLIGAGAVASFAGWSLGPLLVTLALLGTMLSIIVGTVMQYFASLVYLLQLSERVQQDRIGRWCNMMFWLGPLLMIVGTCVMMIGPVVAWLLYWKLIEMVRKSLAEVRGVQASWVPKTDAVTGGD